MLLLAPRLLMRGWADAVLDARAAPGATPSACACRFPAPRPSHCIAIRKDSTPRVSSLGMTRRICMPLRGRRVSPLPPLPPLQLPAASRHVRNHVPPRIPVRASRPAVARAFSQPLRSFTEIERRVLLSACAHRPAAALAALRKRRPHQHHPASRAHRARCSSRTWKCQSNVAMPFRLTS